MRSLVAALAVVVLTAPSPSPVRAAGVFVGTSLGASGYIIDRESDALAALLVPAQSAGLSVFQPGLRVGAALDARRRSAVLLDAGVYYLAQSGVSLHELQLMGSYQFAFSDTPTSSFITAGIGVNSVGTSEGDGVSPLVLGAGVGVRHRLDHGHGAVRTEVRVDHQFEARRHGDLASPMINGFSLRVGFDLDLD